MRLNFEDCGYLSDFESVCDSPEGWVDDPDDWYVSFKAYDCAEMTGSVESWNWSNGYQFDCVVQLVYDLGFYHDEHELARFPARDAKDAERLLQIAADALYGKEEAMKDHEEKCLDRCPVCGEEFDRYNDLEFDRENIYLRHHCGCGQFSVETYKYDNTWWESED